MENQPGASSARSGERAPLTDLTNNGNHQSRRGQKQQSGQGWYARLSDEKKTEYLQRQRIARQQKKAATRSGVNCVEVSQTSATSLRSSQRTPFSNITNTYTNGTYT